MSDILTIVSVYSMSFSSVNFCCASFNRYFKKSYIIIYVKPERNVMGLTLSSSASINPLQSRSNSLQT